MGPALRQLAVVVLALACCACESGPPNVRTPEAEPSQEADEPQHATSDVDMDLNPALQQTCTGSTSRACGQCGTRTRLCSSGEWSPWSSCEGEGACARGTARACGNDGVQECGEDCQWGACNGQTCLGPSAQACGNCGTQTRTCDDRTGAWSTWSACAGEGACTPLATRTCGDEGLQSCSRSCEWSACACPGGRRLCSDRCVDTDSDRDHCGGCGNVCATGAACERGRCVCPSGAHACGGVCTSDALSGCGPSACSQPCPAPASGLGSAICDGGRCGIRCDEGTFAEQGDCRPWSNCTAGSYIEQVASTTRDRVCASCPQGQFSTDSNASACRAWTSCPAGEYVAEAGSASRDRVCVTCPAGMFSAAPNTQQCVPYELCAPGTRQITAGSNTMGTLCGLCVAGQYCPGGVAAASSCGIENYDHDQNAATACRPATVCSPTQSELSPPSSTTDRVCSD